MITSFSNENIKRIRKLRDHKERSRSGNFYIEGLRLVGEAASTGAVIEQLIVAPDLLTSTFGLEIVSRLSEKGVGILEVSAEVFQSFSIKDGPQGIAAVVQQQWTPISDIHPQPGEIWIALDSIQDPGNVGTIIRTMDAIGGKGIILLDHSTDPYDPTATRASMGTIFSLTLSKTDFNQFSGWVESLRLAVIGTSDSAKKDYHHFQYPDPVIVLMGSEQKGLRSEHIALCRDVVSIPMLGKADSLNVSVAAGVVLYEILHQRKSLE